MTERTVIILAGLFCLMMVGIAWAPGSNDHDVGVACLNAGKNWVRSWNGRYDCIPEDER
jgi:hypothetical protein